jgi:hypothetical protein
VRELLLAGHPDLQGLGLAQSHLSMVLALIQWEAARTRKGAG